MQKTVLAIHDLSCVGRCSLTVALPILSACGIHTAALPTALLSTHTGEFSGYFCRDLTGEMQGILGHWETLPLRFDGIYTGFLGSFAQIELVERVIARYCAADTLTLVDPVMADQGRLYATYTREMAEGMGELCRHADVIVPNTTEACLLLGRPWRPDLGLQEVKPLMEALSARYGCHQVIVTGVKENGLLGSAGFSAEDGTFTFAGTEALPQVFYGTGDVFASGLMAAMMCGQNVCSATKTAVTFTHEAMVHTLENGLPLRYGAAFEQAIPTLLHRVGLA